MTHSSVVVLWMEYSFEEEKIDAGWVEGEYTPLCPVSSIPPPNTAVPIKSPASKIDALALVHIAKGERHTLYAIRNKCAHGKGKLGDGDIEDLSTVPCESGSAPFLAPGIALKCPKHRKKFGGGLYFDAVTGESWVPVLTSKFKPSYVVDAYHVKIDAESDMVVVAQKSRSAIRESDGKSKARVVLESESESHQWVEYEVVGVEEHTHNSVLYSFAYCDRRADLPSGAGVGESWHVCVRSACGETRDYTPVSTLDQLTGEGRLDILVKIYPGGLVSEAVFSRLTVGDSLQIAGPEETLAARDLGTPHVVFVAGGTGIAPALQLLKSCGSRFDSFALIISQQTEDDILLAAELDACQSQLPSVTIIHHISSSSGRLDGPSLLAYFDALGGLQDKDVTAVVCGPPTFESLAPVLTSHCNVLSSNVVVLDS